MSAFSISLFLQKTRDGIKLTSNEVEAFVTHLPELNPEHIAAFLGNAFHKNLSDENIITLTHAMKMSGRVLNWEGIDRPVVDKHSTGGIGDKVTLCLAPLISALGLAMPTISGRGLGFTGGTIDKLESVPGFSANIDPEQIQRLVKKHGFAFAQQTQDIAPADKTLYHYRDITGFVSVLQLIVPSILSKKLAENLDYLILDVKCGSGALMKTKEEAKELADFLVKTGNGAGTKTQALITNMNQPLGAVSGNGCEMAEAIAILTKPRENLELCLDTYDLTVALAQKMLMGTTKCTEEEANQEIQTALSSGRAYEIFTGLMHDQGANLNDFERTETFYQKTKHVFEIKAKQQGTIQSMNAQAFGQALILGRAGRQKASDSLYYNTFLFHPKKIGADVQTGDLLCLFGTDDDKYESKIRELLSDAYEISDKQNSKQALINDFITG